MNINDLQKFYEAKKDDDQPMVLIVEDNPGEQKLYSLIDKELGVCCCIVGSCAEGLEAAELLKFNLILMDLQMPDMSGICCARKMQEIEAARGTRTPIIAVTAKAMPEDREKCLKAGFDDYVSKPFRIDELKRKIHVWAA